MKKGKEKHYFRLVKFQNWFFDWTSTFVCNRNCFASFRSFSSRMMKKCPFIFCIMLLLTLFFVFIKFSGGVDSYKSSYVNFNGTSACGNRSTIFHHFKWRTHLVSYYFACSRQWQRGIYVPSEYKPNEENLRLSSCRRWVGQRSITLFNTLSNIIECHKVYD